VDLIPFALIERISADAELWHAPVVAACEAWDVNTPTRVAMFLAQTAHESAGFRRLLENMKYSAAGLVRTWPARFTAADAERMAYDEYAIAERAYGGRMGNRPEGSGDGFAFRGHGLIQVTGRANYMAMGDHLGADLTREPDLLLVPIWAAYAAACFFDVSGCNDAADRDDFDRVTRIINGGINGIADRENWLAIIQQEMTA
jgi:putative chitinase